MRVMLTVAYDGTNYCGWQIQPEADTIEKRLDDAIYELTGEKIHVIGTSRTDSGVHANGNVAVFDTNTRIPAEKLCLALNAKLPADIVIQESRQVEEDFHPRKHVSEKLYEYKILCRNRPLPLYRYDTYYTKYLPEIEKMREAAGLIVGEHDFKGFCSIKTQAETTVRTVYSIDIDAKELIEGGTLFSIKVRGNGFLYNMVRIIAGTLLEVGCGKRSLADVSDAIENVNRTSAGQTAPACGLTLQKITFEDNSFIK